MLDTITVPCIVRTNSVYSNHNYVIMVYIGMIIVYMYIIMYYLGIDFIYSGSATAYISHPHS